MEIKETWKDVIGYEGHYVVSNIGRVKSLDITIIDARGTSKKQIVRIYPLCECNGYYTVTLNKLGKRRHEYVHRLVAKAFINNPNLLRVVMHIDDDGHNNKVSNLKWGSHKDNSIDMVKKNRCNPPSGERNYSSKLKEADVLDVINRTSNGESQSSIAKLYNVCQSTISRIKTRKTWNVF